MIVLTLSLNPFSRYSARSERGRRKGKEREDNDPHQPLKSRKRTIDKSPYVSHKRRRSRSRSRSRRDNTPNSQRRRTDYQDQPTFEARRYDDRESRQESRSRRRERSRRTSRDIDSGRYLKHVRKERESLADSRRNKHQGISPLTRHSCSYNGREEERKIEEECRSREKEYYKRAEQRVYSDQEGGRKFNKRSRSRSHRSVGFQFTFKQLEFWSGFT